MKYANEYQKRYLNYHRLYTARNVMRVDIYDGGKCIIVEKVVHRKQCLRNLTNTTGYS